MTAPGPASAPRAQRFDGLGQEPEPVAAGDRPAEACDLSLDALYRAHSPSLLRFLSRRTASAEDASDLLQETFSRLVRLGGARPLRLDRPEAYLRRVAGNLLFDRARSAARSSAHLHVLWEEAGLAAPDQHALLQSRDALQRLEKAMQRLKPRTREIFLAHRIDGLSYAEIADLTGLTVKGVEKQMSKAIAYIDRAMDRAER